MIVALSMWAVVVWHRLHGNHTDVRLLRRRGEHGFGSGIEHDVRQAATQPQYADCEPGRGKA
ncbi:hypothetical protein Cch02nite_72050 [Catellatospora chokoriensis]|uniref:Uncharacterized protein n=1 Tax=Catellatospora chokoriensis TaxID=310353 RepID=A0A8J3NVC0_9ACTN|nr:hypothetical protein Cch02nite_72050 [Catellatospora chokoriensis]